MIANPGCTDRQRRLAANEDAAASIFNGIATGDIESAIRWQHWLAGHNITRARTFELIGLDPSEFSRNPAWLGRPVAISEYDQASADRVVWMPLEGDDVLGVSTFGSYWLVPANDALPHVVLEWPEARPTTPRSSCCFAPVKVRLAQPVRAIFSSTTTVVPTDRICGLCESELPRGH